MHNTSLSQIIWLSTMAGVVCHKCRVHRCCGRVCQQSWGVLFTQDDLVGMIFVTVMVPWFILSLHSPLHLHLQSVYYLIIPDKKYQDGKLNQCNLYLFMLPLNCWDLQGCRGWRRVCNHKIWRPIHGVSYGNTRTSGANILFTFQP